MSFGTILKKIRIDSNLTQEELAKKINTSRSNIANYENNKNMPSVDILERLSIELNCSLDYLLGITSHKNPKEDLEKELYQFNLTESELNSILNLFMHDSENLEKTFIQILFSQTNGDEKLIRNKKILATIAVYIFDYIPEKLDDKNKEDFHKEFNKAIVPAKKLLLSLDKSKIIHNYNKNVESEFYSKYKSEIEGLTDDEILEALQFYKQIKYGKNK